MCLDEIEINKNQTQIQYPNKNNSFFIQTKKKQQFFNTANDKEKF